MGRLDGKVAFITGAARGQGRSHAVRLAEEGADIIALDICETISTMNYPLATPEDLEQTIKEVEATGRRIIARKGDIRDRAQIEGVLAEGLSEYGHLDSVIANAGICPMKADPTLCKSFADAVDVNLIGTINTVTASLPHLRAGASIVVTGSTAGMMTGTTEMMGGSTGGVGYSYTKQTLIRYVEVLALQLAPHMVRLNAIHPTNVDTQLLHNDDVYRSFRPDLDNPTREEAVAAFPALQAMPIPYLAPSDVSSLVAFLVADESKYMTGLNIRIDAGAMLKGSSFLS
jgi:SDR family mycofactocin-dependent oxidoreductase